MRFVKLYAVLEIKILLMLMVMSILFEILKQFI